MLAAVDRGPGLKFSEGVESMEIGSTHWLVIGAPIVVLAGLIIFLLLRRHKEKPPDDHIFK
jgi:hypothetical protein